MNDQNLPNAATGVVVDAVVIGRNEGLRLEACLKSMQNQTRRVVYVDSGSTDNSVELAKALGAEVVDLDLGLPFTAARARNAGLARLNQGQDPPDFVQFADGDTALDPTWVKSALEGFQQHPDAVVVCGRMRERHPETSIYIRLCDREWNTPIGPARACAGNALIRYQPLVAVGGYREDLIAGEEPELCIRLRRNGGTIWRIDAEMALHDAAITRLSQFLKRSTRAGFAFAEGAALHGGQPERHWVRETWRAVLWGGVLPLVAVLGAILVHPAMIAILLLWPLQALRLAWNWRGEGRLGLEAALLAIPAKVAEARGVIEYWVGRIRGRRRGLIEYK